MYCTAGELMTRIGESEYRALTTRNGTSDLAVAEAAIADASALMDGYLAGRYRLPLETVPVVLVLHCVNIARYNLYGTNPGETVTRNYQESLRYLEKVAAGQLLLALDSNQQPTATDSVIEIQSVGSIWRRQQSRGFL